MLKKSDKREQLVMQSRLRFDKPLQAHILIYVLITILLLSSLVIVVHKYSAIYFTNLKKKNDQKEMILYLAQYKKILDSYQKDPDFDLSQLNLFFATPKFEIFNSVKVLNSLNEITDFKIDRKYGYFFLDEAANKFENEHSNLLGGRFIYQKITDKSLEQRNPYKRTLHHIARKNNSGFEVIIHFIE